MMHVHYRDNAKHDLVAIYRYYAREAGMRIADQFLTMAEAAVQQLAAMPNMGMRYETAPTKLKDIRLYPLSSQFKKFIVFYRPVKNGIEIIRVVHSAQDIPGILSEETS